MTPVSFAASSRRARASVQGEAFGWTIFSDAAEKPSRRQRIERDPPRMPRFLVRAHSDLDVAIESGEKGHQPVDRVFAEIAPEHARDFRLGDPHALAGRGLSELALSREPVNLRHDLSLEEMRL